jgi:hypothetical protein
MASVAGKAKQTSSNKPAKPVANLTEVTDQDARAAGAAS